MKLDELKKILKPLIKEILAELIFEEKGVLSHIIKESISASKDINYIPSEDKRQAINEERMFNIKADGKQISRLPSQEKSKLEESKKKLLESIGKGAYNGVDIFAGTKPLSSGGDLSNIVKPTSPLAGVDPEDAGVPIDKIFENAHLWGKIAAGNKKKKSKEVQDE